MGLFGFILLVVIIFTILGLGWETFSSGVISGFDKALDVGTPVIKNLTQEARDYVDSSERAKDYLISDLNTTLPFSII